MVQRWYTGGTVEALTRSLFDLTQEHSCAVTRKTELEWTYSPADFFPEGDVGTPVGTVRLVSGKATLELATPADPVPPDFTDRAIQAAQALFLARAVATHRTYVLSERPNTVQTADDGRKVVLAMGTSRVTVSGRADFVLLGPDGSVIQDTKAEREGREAALLADLAPKIIKSPVLKALCESYAKASADPADEFVHLYEIRDRLKAHYGSEASAIKALNFRAAWTALGKLTNNAPVSESRHRGLHGGAIRPATENELRDAREAALKLIEAFARTV